MARNSRNKAIRIGRPEVNAWSRDLSVLSELAHLLARQAARELVNPDAQLTTIARVNACNEAHDDQ